MAEFQKLDTLNQFYNYFLSSNIEIEKQFSVHFGLRGRKFCKRNRNCFFSLNQAVHQMQIVSNKSNINEISCKQVTELTNLFKKLEIFKNQKEILNKNNLLIIIATHIARLVGNLFFHRRSILESLQNKFQQTPVIPLQNPSEQIPAKKTETPQRIDQAKQEKEEGLQSNAHSPEIHVVNVLKEKSESKSAGEQEVKKSAEEVEETSNVQIDKVEKRQSVPPLNLEAIEEETQPSITTNQEITKPLFSPTLTSKNEPNIFDQDSDIPAEVPMKSIPQNIFSFLTHIKIAFGKLKNKADITRIVETYKKYQTILEELYENLSTENRQDVTKLKEIIVESFKKAMELDVNWIPYEQFFEKFKNHQLFLDGNEYNKEFIKIPEDNTHYQTIFETLEFDDEQAFTFLYLIEDFDLRAKIISYLESEFNWKEELSQDIFNELKKQIKTETKIVTLFNSLSKSPSHIESK